MIKRFLSLLAISMFVGSAGAEDIKGVINYKLGVKDSIIVHYLDKPLTENIEKTQKKNLVNRLLPGPTYRRVSKPIVFVPRGQWIIGATVSYSENSAENYKFLIVNDINAEGYTVKTEAYVGYALFNDGVLGVRAGYKRTFLDLGGLNLSISDDLNLNIDDYYSLNHSFVGMVFLRNYISLFNSMRFGLFNDLQVSIEQGQGKIMNHAGEKLTGTYTENTKFNVGISPGMTVFINDNAAFEVSVGVLGFESSWVKQTTDQVITGRYRKSSANFKVDLFSLRLGMTFYLNNKKVKMR